MSKFRVIKKYVADLTSRIVFITEGEPKLYVIKIFITLGEGTKTLYYEYVTIKKGSTLEKLRIVILMISNSTKKAMNGKIEPAEELVMSIL